MNVFLEGHSTKLHRHLILSHCRLAGGELLTQ
jgi:hypothetical protein